MHQVIISLASNYQQEENLSEAKACLRQILFSEKYTRAIWTVPFNGKGSSLYLNQLVYADTDLSVEDLNRQLKQFEKQMGRCEDDRQKGIVKVDLDLLLYDDQRYHHKDWDRPYIKELLL